GRRLLPAGVIAAFLAIAVVSLGGALFPAHAAAAANAVVPDASFGNPTFQQMGRNDDGSTAFIPFGFNINFYGHEYSGVYVNNNGNLTFTSGLSTFTPFGLGNSGTPIVAPFFGDVDTVPGGNQVEYSTNTLNGQNVFVANWPGVDCYENDNTKNNFQVIL